jgi:hypothetical protein
MTEKGVKVLLCFGEPSAVMRIPRWPVVRTWWGSVVHRIRVVGL